MKISAEKRAHWEKHLSDWKRSGLTQKAYCSREDLAFTSFKNWRHRLLKSACPQTPTFVEATTKEAE